MSTPREEFYRSARLLTRTKIQLLIDSFTYRRYLKPLYQLVFEPDAPFARSIAPIKEYAEVCTHFYYLKSYLPYVYENNKWSLREATRLSLGFRIGKTVCPFWRQLIPFVSFVHVIRRFSLYLNILNACDLLCNVVSCSQFFLSFYRVPIVWTIHISEKLRYHRSQVPEPPEDWRKYTEFWRTEVQMAGKRCCPQLP